jgi:hypothetical protein
MSVLPVVETADTVIVLRAKAGKLLTKRWALFEGKLQETAHDRAWRFSATEHFVKGVREADELTFKISANPHSAVVRRAIAEGANRKDMLRRARPRQGVPATLMPRPRWWAGLDLEPRNLSDRSGVRRSISSWEAHGPTVATGRARSTLGPARCAASSLSPVRL